MDVRDQSGSEAPLWLSAHFPDLLKLKFLFPFLRVDFSEAEVGGGERGMSFRGQ